MSDERLRYIDEHIDEAERLLDAVKRDYWPEEPPHGDPLVAAGVHALLAIAALLGEVADRQG